jgi:predicted nucleic acid-binding protein
LPAVVSDAGLLIHLAQINKLYLLKELCRQAIITPKIKREAVEKGFKLGHADAQRIGEAIGEGWMIVEDAPEHIVSAIERLAEDENISRADAETLLFAIDKKSRSFS